MAIEDFAELSQFEVHAASVRMLGATFCRRKHVVVLGKVDPGGSDPVTVGMLHPEDGDLIVVLQKALMRVIRPVRLSEFEIQKALGLGFGDVPSEDTHGEREVIRAVDALSRDAQRPVPELVAELLGFAVAAGASDVHLEVYEGDVDVRLRIDGELCQVATALNPNNIEEAVARLKVLAELDIAERREAQDGRIMTVLNDQTGKRSIDFRLSIVPGPFGEDAVLRILDSKPLVGLDRLGFEPATLVRFRELFHNPEGLLLVTGPTGSGKTTTLYSALAEINSANNKLLTVEDPIEYHFAKANQKQVGPKMSFAAFARAFMRQDPDIMLIGEIRDEETADIAVRAAQTGHLVLSTLHTNSSVATIARLGVLGIDPGLISDTLLGALSQRLIRRVCEECAEPVQPTEDEKVFLARLELSLALRRGRGCARCRQTGYRGRVGLYELFAVSEDVAEAIARGASVLELRRLAREQGMETLFDDAVHKLEAGLSTLEEVRARVPHRVIAERLERPIG